MNDRITALETQVGDLRVSNAELSTSVEHLKDSVDKLTTSVGELRDSMNKGRGVLWILTGAAMLAGAGLAKMISKLFAGG